MLVETTIRLKDVDIEFLKRHADFGFSNASELLSKAIHLLKNEVEEEQKLEESAVLYAEIYEEDNEVQEWVEASIKDWE